MDDNELRDPEDYVSYSPSDQAVTVDYVRMVADLTGTQPEEWEEAEGPQTRSGDDLHYAHVEGVSFAQVNVDQGAVSISIVDDDGEETTTGSLDLNESRTWSEMPDGDPLNDDADEDDDEDGDD